MDIDKQTFANSCSGSTRVDGLPRRRRRAVVGQYQAQAARK
jgi:hypothetical protein